jgi:hypothetical protein
MSRWPSSRGSGLQNHSGGCNSRTGLHSRRKKPEGRGKKLNSARRSSATLHSSFILLHSNTGIGVERYTPVFQTGVEGALPSCPSILFGKDAALRRPVGAARRPYLHFLRREIPVSARPHRLRRGGSTPPSCRAWVANFASEVPALTRRELGAIPRQPTTFEGRSMNEEGRNWRDPIHHFAFIFSNASVVKLQSSSASNGESAGGSPAGCTNSISDFEFLIGDFYSGVWFAPNSRGAGLRNREPWRCNSSHADQFPFAPVAQRRGSGLKIRTVSVQV